MINDVIGNTEHKTYIKNEKGEGQYRPYAVRQWQLVSGGFLKFLTDASD